MSKKAPNTQALALLPGSTFRFEQAAKALIAAKRSKHTRTAYTADLRRWIQFCASDVVDPLAPALGATTRFRDHLLASLSKESAKRPLAALSSIYRLLLRSGVVGANPFHPAVLSWPSATAIPKTRIVSDDTAQKMISNAKLDPKHKVRGARDAAILQLLYDTGLRRSSVAITLREKYRDGTLETVVKGGKEAELELPATSVAAIEAWLAIAPASPYLFPGSKGHIDPATINRIVDRRARAVGAPHVHPHSFRAAFVTAGYDAGLPEYEIQHSVHHTDPDTTRRYDRRARGRQVAAQVSKWRGKL